MERVTPEEIKNKLAVEVVARFPFTNGNKGRVTKLRKEDFIESAKFMFNLLQNSK